MRLSVYSVLDAVAGVYCKPFSSQNDGIARRDFDNASRDPQSVLHQNPADFGLYHIGYFDEDSGLLEPCQPRFITRPISQE